MAKLQRLLNENTIVDLKMILRLCSRYKSLSVLAPLIFIASVVILSLSRPVLYSASAPIKVFPKNLVGKEKQNFLATPNDNLLSVEELRLNIQNRAFLNSLAKNLIEDSSFKLSSFLGSSKELNQKAWDNCKKVMSCETLIIASALDESIHVESGLTEDRFNLIVTSADKSIPHFLMKHLIPALENERVKIGQYALRKELASVEDLLKESQAIMNSRIGENPLEEQSVLSNKISNLKDEAKIIQQSVSNESINISALSAKLHENKKNIEPQINQLDKPEAKEARVRIQELKTNILQLKAIANTDQSKNDKKIISQLESELNQLSRKYRSVASLQSFEQKENFFEKQREGQKALEFDLQVAKMKLSKLNQEYESIISELNLTIERKMALDSKVGSLQTDMLFQKELESKQMSLKLNIATYTSDILFEDFQIAVKSFRTTSMFFICLWSFLLAVGLYLFMVIIKFISDDKIYQADDVHHSIAGLSFVGEVPAFSDKLK